MTNTKLRLSIPPLQPRTRRMIARGAVLVPTVAMSALLGAHGVPIGPRVMLTLIFGYMLIKAVLAVMQALSDRQ